MARTRRAPASAGRRAAPARAHTKHRAIYAGSFDPLTNGHVDLITRGLALFDELVVAIGHNPAKRGTFSVDERMALVRQIVPDVEVIAFEGLLVTAARAHGANVILRGVRTISDFELEYRNGLANRDLSGIETLFLLADPALSFVSSSLVKEIASNGGDVDRYVPGPVLGPLKAKLGR
jgi:pantetheine-phosphate adenylyltransferase